MRVAQVVGKVVLSRVHPSLIGSQFKIVVPLTFDDLAFPCPVEAAEKTVNEEKEAGVDAETSTENAANRLLNSEIPRKWGNEVVAYDDCSAAVGEWIALSEGAEAAAAFQPNQKPVDAFCGAILDELVVDAETVATLAAKK
ncbi:MAG: hypothetical protein IKU86_08870 [Thermoguttaceae bacterium]|nr:hypothetical protein [Thermoguttaceae bacterium]